MFAGLTADSLVPTNTGNNPNPGTIGTPRWDRISIERLISINRLARAVVSIKPEESFEVTLLTSHARNFIYSQSIAVLPAPDHLAEEANEEVKQDAVVRAEVIKPFFQRRGRPHLQQM